MFKLVTRDDDNHGPFETIEAARDWAIGLWGGDIEFNGDEVLDESGNRLALIKNFSDDSRI